MKRGFVTALASCAKYSRLCWRAIVSLSLFWKSLLVRCCKFRTRCLGRARARARREEKFLDLAFPTEDAIVEICGWSAVKVVTEHPVTEDSPRVVEAVSDCSSGEAGFDGILIEGGERKVRTGSAGCSKLMASRLGSRTPDRSRQAKNRRSPLTENLNTKNH